MRLSWLASVSRIALVFGVVFSTAGCVHVNRWERGSLARIQRANDSSAATHHYDAHFWSVRSGMAGGTGEPGGGCGCN
ncbi:MAG: DUF4266 domain-containing protein [Deltaproteobacteria bacterium]|nr:DUF4266 domain-containing protein [Deltaproteobacteria bacterium]